MEAKRNLLLFILIIFHFFNKVYLSSTNSYPCQELCKYECYKIAEKEDFQHCPENCNSSKPSCCNCLLSYSQEFGPIRVFCYDFKESAIRRMIRWDTKKEENKTYRYSLDSLTKKIENSPNPPKPIYLLKYKSENENKYTSFNVSKKWFVLKNLQEEINYDIFIHKYSNYNLWKHETIYIKRRNEGMKSVNDLKIFEIKFNQTIDYSLNWTFNKEPACTYRIIIKCEAGHGSKELIDHMILEGAKHDLKDFYYDSPYNITIKDVIPSSQSVSLLFTTPTCFEKNPTQYKNHCRPDRPEGLVTSDKLIDSSVKPFHYNLIVTWNKPKWIPDNYNLTLTVDNKNKTSWELPGNISETVIPDVDLGSTYRISLKGRSLLGYGLASVINKNYSPSKKESLTINSESNIFVKEIIDKKLKSPNFWMNFVFGSVFFIGIGIFSWLLIRKRYKPRLDSERSDYFKEIKNKSSMEKSSSTSISKLEISENSDETWTISSDQLTIESILGQGAFGVVHKGLLRQKHSRKIIEVAVKMLRDHPTSEDIYQFDQELQMMMALGQHPHVVSLIGVSKPNNKALHLIVEFCALGDLQHFLRKALVRISNTSEENRIKYADLFSMASSEENSSTSTTDNLDDQTPNLVINHLYDKHLKGTTIVDLSPTDLLSFARQIAIGMEFLSKNRIIHRDLAARNILLTENRIAKIADFGLSRDIYERNIYRTSGAGRRLPIKWMAIESLLYHVFTTQSDVWSFGIVLWEIVTLGGMPYPGTAPDEVFKLLNSGYRMERPANCSYELYGLMLACWRRKPSERPNFIQIHCQLDSLLQSSSTANSYLNLQQENVSNRIWDEEDVCPLEEPIASVALSCNTSVTGSDNESANVSPQSTTMVEVSSGMMEDDDDISKGGPEPITLVDSEEDVEGPTIKS